MPERAQPLPVNTVQLRHMHQREQWPRLHLQLSTAVNRSNLFGGQRMRSATVSQRGNMCADECQFVCLCLSS